MRYFTIEEAAKLLKYTTDQIYALAQPERIRGTLALAYVVGTPLDAKDSRTGKSCKVSPGAYEITSFITYASGVKRRSDFPVWDQDGFAYVQELSFYEPYEQPAHLSMALYPTEGSNRRRNLAFGKPEIIAACEKKFGSDEHEGASPKSWMDGLSPEEAAPIEGDDEGNTCCPLDEGETSHLSSEELAWVLNEMDRGLWPSPVSVVNRFSQEFILWQGGWMRSRSYLLDGDPITVTKSQLIILDWTLAAYMQANGMAVPEALQGEFNAAAFVDDCRKRLMSKELIALELKEYGLKDEDIGSFLPHPRWGKNKIEPEAVRKYGERLWKKGKKMRDKT